MPKAFDSDQRETSKLPFDCVEQLQSYPFSIGENIDRRVRWSSIWIGMFNRELNGPLDHIELSFAADRPRHQCRPVLLRGKFFDDGVQKNNNRLGRGKKRFRFPR